MELLLKELSEYKNASQNTLETLLQLELHIQLGNNVECFTYFHLLHVTLGNPNKATKLLKKV